MKFIQKILCLDGVLAGIAMTGVFLLQIMNVILRYFWSQPLPWADEVTGLLLTWSVFLGGSYLVSIQENIRIEIYEKGLFAKILNFITIDMIIMVISILVLIFSIKLLKFSRSTPILNISYVYFYSAMIAFSVLNLLHFLVKYIDFFAKEDK